MLNFRAGERAEVKSLLRKQEGLSEFDPQPPPLGDKDRQVSGGSLISQSNQSHKFQLQ